MEKSRKSVLKKRGHPINVFKNLLSQLTIGVCVVELHSAGIAAVWINY